MFAIALILIQPDPENLFVHEFETCDLGVGAVRSHTFSAVSLKQNEMICAITS